MASFFVIDRRLNPKGKSFANRQRFVRRTTQQIRDALKEALPYLKSGAHFGKVCIRHAG